MLCVKERIFFMKTTTQKLTFTAIMIALSTVLSMIPAIQLPFGGKATLLSMLPVMLIAIKYDLRWGFFSTFAYSLIQLALSLAKVLSWGLTPWVLLGCIMLDYILPYTFLFVAGAFKNSKNGILLGVASALIIRFLLHFLSGIILWDSLADNGFACILGSITYNGSYMLPELIFTLVATVILLKTPKTKKLFFEK